VPWLSKILSHLR